MSAGQAMPARVGFDSVKSRIGAPDRRLAATKDVRRFSVRSHRVREENIAPMLHYAA
jgi:hypothetical protein